MACARAQGLRAASPARHFLTSPCATGEREASPARAEADRAWFPRQLTGEREAEQRASPSHAGATRAMPDGLLERGGREKIAVERCRANHPSNSGTDEV